MERAQIHEDATLVSMDFTSLLTNIPQEEGEEQYVRYPGREGGRGVLPGIWKGEEIGHLGIQKGL